MACQARNHSFQTLHSHDSWWSPIPEPTGATSPTLIRRGLDLHYPSLKLVDYSLFSWRSLGNCARGRTRGQPPSAGEPSSAVVFRLLLCLSVSLSLSLALVVVEAGVENPPGRDEWLKKRAASAPLCPSFFCVLYFANLISPDEIDHDAN